MLVGANSESPCYSTIFGRFEAEVFDFTLVLKIFGGKRIDPHAIQGFGGGRRGTTSIGGATNGAGPNGPVGCDRLAFLFRNSVQVLRQMFDTPLPPWRGWAELGRLRRVTSRLLNFDSIDVAEIFPWFLEGFGKGLRLKSLILFVLWTEFGRLEAEIFNSL